MPNRPARSARRLLLAGGLGLAIALVAYVAYLLRSLPDTADLRKTAQAQPSVLLARDGQVLYTFRRERYDPVTLDEVSPRVLEALIATEDHRFFDHRGIDVYRTLGACWLTINGDPQGGSTLTQQLARNLFPQEIGRSRSVNRKLKEMLTALRIERVYSKRQIVELYLNSTPFLYNVVGIEMAARTYFGKRAAELDTLEAATLVGMLKGPHYYNPVRFPERARERRNVVLAQMAKHGVIQREALARLTDVPLQVQFNRETESLGLAPHFVVHARRWLLDWAEAQGHDLYADGLSVHTSIDPSLQKAAEQAATEQADALQQVADVEWSAARSPVASRSPAAYAAARRQVQPFAHWWRLRPEMLEAALRESPAYREQLTRGLAPDEALRQVAANPASMQAAKARKTRLEAGLVALDPATGEVRAWVGSRDFAQDEYDHVAQAQRQPGSTFKPFVYGAALEAGISPLRSYIDEPVEVNLGGGKRWKPTDMTGFSGQPMSLRDGLVHSKNTITTQVMLEVGVPRVAALAKQMGVNLSALDPVPSLALGTSTVTLLEMTSAYATIARLGTYHTPIFVTRITDRHGHTLASFGGDSRQALSRGSAIELIDMMRGVVQRGTGTQVKTRFGIVADIAGKTGTTQNNTDGWFILMHPQLVVGAWVGFNDARVSLRSNHWGQGGHNAILLVGDFFRDALKTKAVDADASFPPSAYAPSPGLPRERPDAWIDEEDTTEPMRPEPPNAEPEWPSGDAPGAPAGPGPSPDMAAARIELDRLLERLAMPGGTGADSPAAGGEALRPVGVNEAAIAAPLRTQITTGLDRRSP
jgi:penicillin-binding protein 1A